MQGGRIVKNGPTAEVLSSPDLPEFGAVAPQVAQFGHAMAAAGMPLEHIPITIEDAIKLVQNRKGAAK